MNDHVSVEQEGYNGERHDRRAPEVPSSVGHFRPREKQERGAGEERGCEFAREDAQDREREQGRLAAAPRDSTDFGQGQEEEAEAQGVLVHVPGESKGDEGEGTGARHARVQGTARADWACRAPVSRDRSQEAPSRRAGGRDYSPRNSVEDFDRMVHPDSPLRMSAKRERISNTSRVREQQEMTTWR